VKEHGHERWTDQALADYADELASIRHKAGVVDAFMTTLERLQETQKLVANQRDLLSRRASMADQINALDNAERLLEEHGVYCVRRLEGWWVLDAGARTVTATSLHEAFLELGPQSTVGDET
jgi:hypothetical protein